MSISRNFFFSSILTASNYIFPFIVYPYIARVLGPTNVGICNFVDSIVNYAMLISLMGITVMGTRSIAKVKNDANKLNETFTALFILTATFTLLASIALITVTFTIESLYPYKKLLLIGLIKIWGNFLLIDWLYNGLEDFRYITMRSIIVKLCYVGAVFIFIHAASDYVLYFLFLCLMVAVNAAINCFRASKLISFKYNFKVLQGFIAPFFMLGFYLLLNSMYTTFNIIYLGFCHGDAEVGYYSTSTKIFKVILALYTAYTAVVIPRASSLISEGKQEEFKRLIRLSTHALMLFSIPIIIIGMIFSPGIIYLIAGSGYTQAITPMLIVMPLLFIIGYEQTLVLQILTPMANDKIILLNSIVGASVGIVGNILLVKPLGAVGSAIIWLVAEVAILLTSQHFVTKFTGIKFPYKEFFTNLVAYVPLAIILLALVIFCPIGSIKIMVIGCVIAAAYFLYVQFKFLKNPVFLSFSEKIAVWNRNKKQ